LSPAAGKESEDDAATVINEVNRPINTTGMKNSQRPSISTNHKPALTNPKTSTSVKIANNPTDSNNLTKSKSPISLQKSQQHAPVSSASSKESSRRETGKEKNEHGNKGAAASGSGSG